MMKRCAFVAALALALAPASARADWLFTPMVGSTFGADASGNEHFTVGASIGWMGAGVFGWEADFAYTPQFFEPPGTGFDLTGGNNVVSAMANVIIGIPVGGQRGPGFRPYVTAGLGMLQREVHGGDDLFDVDTNDFGYNVGGGAMGFVTDHVGFRGDLRYLRSFEDSDDGFGITAGNFDFWRGTGGIVFRW